MITHKIDFLYAKYVTRLYSLAVVSMKLFILKILIFTFYLFFLEIKCRLKQGLAL